MGFRGSRVQIPPSRLIKELALQRLPLWGFFFIAPHNYNAASGPPVRASGGETQEIRVRNLVECLRHAGAARSSCEAGRLALATDPIGSILHRYSDALIPEARCRAARVCLEGSKSRNRLSEVPAWPVLFFPRVMGWNSSRLR